MVEPLRFGGTDVPPHLASTEELDEGLRVLLGALDAEKYLVTKPRFVKPDYRDLEGDELKDAIAHWAGRVWFHEHGPVPAKHLANFDLWTLKDEFFRHLDEHGDAIFDVGLTIEEGWASHELFDAEPMTLILSRRFADEPTAAIPRKRLADSDVMVWLLGLICLRLRIRSIGFNALVTDGRTGHAIQLTGLNGLDYIHPRHDHIRPGWFSFHDRWPARSLLAADRDFVGVRVVEDVARPPYWLICPADLDRVIVGFLLSVRDLNVIKEALPMIDAVEFMRRRDAGFHRPMWVEDPERPDEPFALTLASTEGWTPILADTLHGLGQVALLLGETETADDLFGKAERARRVDRAFDAHLRRHSGQGHG
jgi:hypothetical protein